MRVHTILRTCNSTHGDVQFNQTVKFISLLRITLLTLFVLLMFVAYTTAKYGMSLCVLGMAEEFKKSGIAVNALWPQTGNITLWCPIETAATLSYIMPLKGFYIRKKYLSDPYYDALTCTSYLYVHTYKPRFIRIINRKLFICLLLFIIFVIYLFVLLYT